MKNFIGYTIGGALTVGASVIPSLIFSGLVFQHTGEYAYLLPVVLLIVVEKSFIFLIQGFGKIQNPTKLLLSDLMISMAGTVIAMFGYVYAPLWSIGAVLIGSGMSIYAPMFRTYRDNKRRNHTWESNPAVAASYIALVVILAVVFLLRHQYFNIILGIYLVLQLFTFVFMYGKLQEAEDRDQPMFDHSGRSSGTIAAAAVTMLVTLFVSFYKETADTRYAFWILAGYSILLIVFAWIHPMHYRDYAKRTFWYGAMRTFLNTFGMIYFAAVGLNNYVSLVYVMYGLGIGLSKVIGKPLKKLTGEDHYESICILLALLSSCLLLTFKPVLMLVGILLGVMFVSAGNTNSAYIYLDDDSYPFNDRHLVRTKFFATGAVMAQGLLMVLLLAVTEVMKIGKNDPLHAYVYTQGDISYTPVFAWTLALSLIILAVGIFISQKKSVKKTA